jgi:hypothetical protein
MFITGKSSWPRCIPITKVRIRSSNVRAHYWVTELYFVGVLIVHLDGRTGKGEKTVRVDEITQHIEKADRQCILM